MFKTRGGGQRPFEQCSKKLHYWHGMASLNSLKMKNLLFFIIYLFRCLVCLLWSYLSMFTQSTKLHNASKLLPAPPWIEWIRWYFVTCVSPARSAGETQGLIQVKQRSPATVLLLLPQPCQPHLQLLLLPPNLFPLSSCSQALWFMI